MTDPTPNPITGDPFCEVARAIQQDSRKFASGNTTLVVTSIPVLMAGVVVGGFVGIPTGPAAPVSGIAAGTATVAALTAGIYFAHEGIHSLIDRRQNQTPATAPGDMTCKQYLSHAAMSSLKTLQQWIDEGGTRYEGSGLQKVLRANPRVLDEILATPIHSDPMNVGASMEEKHLRGFAVDHAPRPMTRSEQRWGEYSRQSP